MAATLAHLLRRPDRTLWLLAPAYPGQPCSHCDGAVTGTGTAHARAEIPGRPAICRPCLTDLAARLRAAPAAE